MHPNPQGRGTLEHRAVELLGLRRPPASANTAFEVSTFVAHHLTFDKLDELRQGLEMRREPFVKILNISMRTFERGGHDRKKTGRDIADRALRLARVSALAEEVLEDPAAAREWLAEPQPGLAGRVPNDLLVSEFGAREVEDLLQRIASDVYV